MKDLIERQKAIDALDKHLRTTDVPISYPGIISALTEWLNELPSAQPESLVKDLVEDTISRQAAMDALIKAIRKDPYYDSNEAINGLGVCDVRVILNDLPSAQPERNTGWWLIREGISDAQCSECKMYFRDVYDMDNSDAFCRHCGAKMEGLKVVEDE